MHAGGERLKAPEDPVNQHKVADGNDDSPSDCVPHLRHNVMFQVVPIKIFGSRGVVTDFALLDGGSGVTMMDRSLCEEAGLKGEADALHLKWTGRVTHKERCQRVSVVVAGSNCEDKYKLENVYVRDELALPPQSRDDADLKQRYPHLRGLPF